MVSIAYSTTTGISGLMERVTVGPRAVAWVRGGRGGEGLMEEQGRGGRRGRGGETFMEE